MVTADETIPACTLKRRCREGAALHIPYASMRDPRERLAAEMQAQQADMLFVDGQHAPFSDIEFIEFCAWANALGRPVLFRIPDPQDAYRIGRYCDFGAAGIVVPMVEDAAVARAAVEAFYYPNQGRRSWGPGHAFGLGERPYGTWTGFAYADWWNRHGVLMLQLESAAAVGRIRELALPGVDLLVFGGADLTLDLGRGPNRWPDAQTAIDAAAQACADLPIRVARIPAPFGRFPAEVRP